MTGRWDRSMLQGLALARGNIDRAAEKRDDTEWLAAAWAAPGSRVIEVVDGQVAVADCERPKVAWQPTGRIGAGIDVDRFFLGLVAGDAHFAVAPTGDHEQRTGWAGLREVGADLSDEDAGLLVTAVALSNWHATHRRCPRCGTPTDLVSAGWMRRCPADESQHFPRTDPAVIALVIDGGDRALLGRQVTWPEHFFSTLAGFVESGESAEDAVRREVFEESGVRVDEIQYLGSQPWPFPASLMLGYHASAVPGAKVVVDGREIAEAHWFSRDELVSACQDGRVRLPSRVSIARRLIERWFGTELPGEWSRQ